jgi:hypothetical protein
MFNVRGLRRGLDLSRRLASSVGPFLIAGAFHFILTAQARRRLEIEIELLSRRAEREMIFTRALAEDRIITEEELTRILRPFTFNR